MPEFMSNSPQNGYPRNQPSRKRHTLSPNYMSNRPNHNQTNRDQQIKRHWFDETTANSLERASRRNSPKPRNGGSSTLPRMFKQNMLSRVTSPTPRVVSPRSVTSDTWETSCDSINFALNNSINRFEAKSPIYVKELPADNKTKPKQFGNTYYDVRPRSCSPALLNAIRDEDAPTNKLSPVITEQSSTYSDNDVTDSGDMIGELIVAMKELKDLAEITRIIDEVDDEEWLLVFIGELQIHLNDMLKPEPNSSSEGEMTYEEKKKQQRKDENDKKTLLKVTLDLIAYLKRRFADYLGPHDSKDNTEGAGTLKRLRKLAESKKTNDPFIMNKWQRKLSCLVITLDQFLNKMAPQESAQCAIPVTSPFDSELKMVTSSTSSEDKPDSSPSTSPQFQYRSMGAKFRSQPKRDVTKPGTDSMTSSQSGDEKMDITPNSANYTSSFHFRSRSNDAANNPRTRDVDSSDKGIVTSSYVFGNDKQPAKSPTRNVAVAVRCSTPGKDRGGRKLYYAVSRSSISTASSDGDVQNNNEPAEKRGPAQTSEPGGRRGRSSVKYTTSSKVSDKYLEARSKFDSSGSHVTERGHAVAEDRHRRGGSLDRRTWKRERSTRRKLSVTSDDSSVSSDVFHVSGFSRICEVNSDVTGRPSRLSEFSIRVNDVGDGKKPSGQRPRVIEEDRVPVRTCRESMTSLDGRNREEKPKVMTSSSSTQCDIVSKAALERSGEELDRMKKRSDLLQRGLTEAREERDEKDRKIAVLESKVQRIKKMVEAGRSERGSVEVQLERLRNILESERRDSERQIKDLEEKLKSMEERARRDEQRVHDLRRMIARLQEENQDLKEKCKRLSNEKSELEMKLNEEIMTSLEAKRQNRRLQNENVRLEEELSQANEKLRETELMESQENVSETLVQESMCHQEYDEENYSQDYDEELRRENEELLQLNNELKEKLARELESTDTATDCFRQQIEYLSSEVSLQQESAQAQKNQYEAEIERILSSRASTSTAEHNHYHEITTLESQIEYHQSITTTLYIENERLRKERDTLKCQLQEDSGPKKNENGVDFGCQVEDTSYTRMRAFDFYAQEAHRNGLRLVARGRQLQEESMRVAMRTTKTETEIIRKRIT